MKVLDLFAGCGGLSTGLESAGFIIDTAIEYHQKYADTYQKNHQNTKMVCGDIKNIDHTQFKNIDIIAGGPPCQGFSTAGKKQECDIRNSLYLEFIRFVDGIRPDYVIFENVSGFKTLYGGKFYKHLIEKFNSIGYNYFFDIFDMSEYGIPQKRKRFICIAYNRKYTYHKPEKKQDKQSLFDAIGDLPALQSGESSDTYGPATRDLQKKLKNNCTILTEHAATNHNASVLSIIQQITPGKKMSDFDIPNKPKGFDNNYNRPFYHQPSNTITGGFIKVNASEGIHPTQHRGFTIREGARIQTFKDTYVFCGNKQEKAQQIGNAIPPMFAEMIGKSILECIQ